MGERMASSDALVLSKAAGAGALVLVLLSAAQKVVLGVSPVQVRGYVIPVVFGVGAGVVLGHVYRRRVRAERERVRFECAIEETGHAVYITDADGTIEYVNPAFETITGYSKAEAVGRNPRLLQSGEMPDEYYERLWDTVTSGEIWVEEVTNERRSGEHYTAEQTIAPITEDGAVTGYVAVQHDTTERRRNEIHLQKAQEVANLGWWRKDIPSDQIVWSDRIYEMWGVETDRPFIDHETFLEFVHPEDRGDVQQQWQAAKDGAPFDVEHRIVTGDGEQRWMREKADVVFDDDGTPVRALGIVQDITERKAREQQLTESNTVLRAIVETLPMGILVEDANRDILMVNDALGSVLGVAIDSDDLIGSDCVAAAQNLKDQFADPDAFLEGIDQRIEDGVQVRNEELQLADDRVLERDYVPYTLPDGEANLWLYRDVTEQRDIEANLQKHNRQLLILDRVLRHNLHNDMNVIMGHAEFIQDVPDADPQSHAEMIVSKSEQLLDTVDKEREITKLLSDPSSITQIDADAVTRTSIAAIRNQHPSADISLSITDSATVRATTDLSIAIEELLTNSVVHSDRATPHVDVHLQTDHDHVRIRVADDGSGIPEVEQEVLTNEQTIEPLFHGSGLGLWLVNEIVVQSEGSLTFEENDPRGSIVTIRLDRHDASDDPTRDSM